MAFLLVLNYRTFFPPKLIKGLDAVPREARRASSALSLSPTAVFVPRRTAKPLGRRYCLHPCLFFGYMVKVWYTVWPRISVGSVQFCFWSSSSFSFVEIQRRSSFRSPSFVPFGAYETCFCRSSWALLPFFGTMGVLRHRGLGGRCVGLFSGEIWVCFLLRDEEGSQEGQWRRGIHCVHRRNKMYVTEEEASERSRESMESARSETRKRRTACTWTGSERAFEGEQDRIHAGVVTQAMEGDGVDSLWRAMSVIEGGQGTSAEAKEVRARVVTAVEERSQAGEMQEPLPQGETGWKEYVRKLVQGRRMGGPPEVEAWAVKNGYRVKVYRETNNGEGYRKIQEYGGEKGVLVGILWRKTRVYEVVWEQEETGEGTTTGEAGRAGTSGGAQVRVGAGGERGHSVASGESRPSTCGAGSVGSTAGNEEEQQHQAAWAWKRREGALEGARERAEDGVLVEHMHMKDVNTLWEVLCALEGRPNSEEEVQRIRQGVATRVESRHNMGEMEECLPQEEASWQKYIQRTRQGRRMGGHRRWKHGQRRGGTRWRFTRRQKAETGTESWWSMGKEPRGMRESCGPSEEPMRFCGLSVVGGVTRQKWRRRCKGCWTVNKRDRNGRKKCRKGRGDRSYQGMTSASIGHSARWREQGGKRRQKRCAKRSRRGIWRGPQSRAGRRES